MSDVELRKAERALESEKSLSNLRRYLIAIVRLDQEINEEKLISIIRQVSPFTNKDWPFYSTYNDTPEYRENTHEQVLRWLVRTRPLPIITSFEDPRDISVIMNVLRRQYYEPTDYDEYEDVGYVPDYIYLEKGDDEIAIATVVEEWGDNRIGANRYGIGYGPNVEPAPGIFWQNRWVNSQKQWRSDWGHWESTTLIPYKEWCSEHKQNLEKCAPCVACKAKAHGCQCFQCEDCGGWFNQDEGWRMEFPPNTRKCDCDD